MTLSDANHHPMSRKLSGKWGTQYPNTELPLLILLCGKKREAIFYNNLEALRGIGNQNYIFR